MRTALKALFHSILVIGSVVALSNCGNSKNEDDSQTGTTVPRQKNAALFSTTLPAKAPVTTATNPAVISTTSIAKAPTKATNPAFIPTTSIAKTVTTPLPSLPKRKP